MINPALNSFLPHTLADWIGLVGLATLGVFGILGAVDSQLKGRRSEKDNIEERLIEGFKTRVNQLEEDLKIALEEIGKLKDQMVRMKSENDLMREILENRDQESMEYRKKAIESMKFGPMIVDTLNRMEKRQSKVIGHLDKACKTLDKKLHEKGGDKK